MADFEKKFRKSIKSKIFLLDNIMSYIVKRKGKQIRPMLVFLTSQLCGGTQEATYRGAALIELLHTATLVHDDVIDDANQRRGFLSINAIWKNKISVLVGDYLLSRGLLLSVENGDYDLLQIVSRAVKEMSEGELLQMEKSKFLNINEEVYLKIIRQKTATLISACCAVGANTAGASEDTVNQMALFGEKIGIAFQIKDDLFDYGEGSGIGKPMGIDIKEKKLTLPLIYALRNSSWFEKRRIINRVKQSEKKPYKVAEVVAFVKESGGIEYATQKMKKYYHEALEILDDFPDSEAKDSLLELVKFIIERKK
eukprot:TRINITY_DN69492_c0_g1_i1.p1 TRINITY_DN69492_c0_g1~~TRINITY_DN69492_c0_g1_i1.p1  ORF type:complete len:311 (+),score=-30.13 TRINITY_DN69492_c0_g1_i1:80-1012(+)